MWIHLQIFTFNQYIYLFFQKSLDANKYATKKTIAQGLLDVALLTANASQLKYVLQVGEEHEFYTLMLTLIIISMVLQVSIIENCCQLSIVIYIIRWSLGYSACLCICGGIADCTINNIMYLLFIWIILRQFVLLLLLVWIWWYRVLIHGWLDMLFLMCLMFLVFFRRDSKTMWVFITH